MDPTKSTVYQAKNGVDPTRSTVYQTKNGMDPTESTVVQAKMGWIRLNLVQAKMGSDRIHHSTTVLNYFVLSFTNFAKTKRERERRKCQLCPDIRGGGGKPFLPLIIN